MESNQDKRAFFYFFSWAAMLGLVAPMIVLYLAYSA